MIENRLWSHRSAGWANISVKVEMLEKNKVSSLKNYSDTICHLSCKDNFMVGSNSEATNLGYINCLISSPFCKVYFISTNLGNWIMKFAIMKAKLTIML